MYRIYFYLQVKYNHKYVYYIIQAFYLNLKAYFALCAPNTWFWKRSIQPVRIIFYEHMYISDRSHPSIVYILIIRNCIHFVFMITHQIWRVTQKIIEFFLFFFFIFSLFVNINLCEHLISCNAKRMLLPAWRSVWSAMPRMPKYLTNVTFDRHIRAHIAFRNLIDWHWLHCAHTQKKQTHVRTVKWRPFNARCKKNDNTHKKSNKLMERKTVQLEKIFEELAMHIEHVSVHWRFFDHPSFEKMLWNHRQQCLISRQQTPTNEHL